MDMSMVPRMRMSIECRVCRQEIDSERAEETRREVALFGMVKYAICLCCHQLVSDSENRNYRARWRRFKRRSTTGGGA